MFKAMRVFFRDYKHFFVAFVLSLIVFGSMFGVTLYSVTAQKNETAAVDNPQQDIPINDNYIPSVDDNLPLLLMLGESKNTAPTTYLLVHFSATTNKCTVVELPRLIRVSVDGKTKTLDGFYKFSGTNGATTAVRGLFSLAKCEYLRLDKIGIKNMVDYFSGVKYDVKAPVNAENYSFQAGEQLLDGARVSELMLADNFDEKGELAAAFLKEHMDSQLAQSLESVYEVLFEQSETSLNRATLMRYEVPAQRFLKSNYEKIFAEVLPGVNRDGAFVPEYEVVKTLEKAFAQGAEDGI